MNDLDYINRRVEEINNELTLCSSNSVELLPVSKYIESKVMRYCYTNNIFNVFGENIVQDLLKKIEDLKDTNLQFDFIGNLQTNKIKYIYNKVRLIHSITKTKQLEILNRLAFNDKINVNYLIQINLSKEDTKQGIYLEDIENFCEITNKYSNCKLRGLMCTVKNTNDISYLSDKYSKLAVEFDKIKKANISNDFNILSAGMSNDYKIAIEYGGANIIRVGRKIFTR